MIIFDRLRQNIDDLEAAQAFMIPREFIEKHEETIETQKEDLKKLEGSHKLLVQRYGALKAAIEASFRQYEEAEEARKLAELTAAAEAAAGSGAAGRGSSDGNEITTMDGEEIVSASASSSPTKRRKKGNSSVKASPVPTRKGSLVPEDSNEEHEKKSLVLSSSISSSPSKHHEDRDPLHMVSTYMASFSAVFDTQSSIFKYFTSPPASLPSMLRHYMIIIVNLPYSCTFVSTTL
jgi:hypothetical protein